MDPRIHEIESHNPELTGYYEFKSRNQVLGCDMSVSPCLMATEQKFIQIFTEAQVLFTRAKTGAMLGSPYIITQTDIPGLDFRDPAMIEEIFDRYDNKFQSLAKIDDHSQLAHLVFVDIEERREERQKESDTKLA